MDDDVPPNLAGHPDRIRWNAKYADAEGPGGRDAPFAPHPLAERALALAPPPGRVLDLACGLSGSALLAAGQGREVTAVDVSEVALGLLDARARRLGVRDLLDLVQADLREWLAQGASGFAAVLCTGFWDPAVFVPAVRAVAPGGVLGWEAFTAEARRRRPRLPAEWCLAPGEPATLLPPGFTVLGQEDVADGTKRRVLARFGENRPAGLNPRS